MSKIRLHGSSSGHTEVAPAAAAGNNTVTLPNSAGTLLLTDGSAASLTQIPAANIVGVATGGFKKSGETSLQVLEQFYLLADGRSVSTSNGTVTTTNVTAKQALTDSFVTATGSSLTYQPPTGTTELIYEYKFMFDESNGSDRYLFAYHVDIDGTAILESRGAAYTAADTYNDYHYIKYGFRIGTDRLENDNLEDSMLELHSFFGEDDPPWTGGYSLRHAAGSFLYEPTLSNTGSASKIMEGAETCMFDVQFFHHTKNGGTLYLNQGKSNSNTDFFPGTCSFTIFEIKR